MIGVANAPCSWGVIENVAGDTAGYRRVLDEMAETGYAGTELGDWGFMPTDPATLRASSMPAGWRWSGRSRRPGCRTAPTTSAAPTTRSGSPGCSRRSAGSEALVIVGRPLRRPGAFDRGRARHRRARDDRRGWRSFIDGIHLVARRVRDEAGIRTVIHQHLGTLIESMAEVRRLLDVDGPELVGVCIDTGHWTFGTGGDPAAAVRELGERLARPLQGLRPGRHGAVAPRGWDGLTSTGNGVFCELGTGSVDSPGVLRALREIDYQGWIVVEQDILPGMGDPRESARRIAST